MVLTCKEIIEEIRIILRHGTVSTSQYKFFQIPIWYTNCTSFTFPRLDKNEENNNRLEKIYITMLRGGLKAIKCVNSNNNKLQFTATGLTFREPRFKKVNFSKNERNLYIKCSVAVCNGVDCIHFLVNGKIKSANCNSFLALSINVGLFLIF